MNKVTKAISHWLLWLPLTLLVLIVTAISIDSFGCNYEMKMNTAGIDYQGVCRWGMLSIIEEEPATKAKWQVDGWQVAFMNQFIFFVSERRLLNKGNGQHSALNNYNQLQSDYTIVNYTWVPLTKSHIAMFQKTPHHDVILVQQNGWFSFSHRLFPATPLLGNK
ncbi:hypothetical protein J9885_07485 [Aeromonas sp. SrichE-2G]|uniref:hypothetical protein n=1 Tax=Aeromonas sp. SrichE-2G TaxID=2823359 RepID=UPI001B336B40|nr:hypothetical protein [Aeromonas sp. SrichE-2G]MBP4041106.1 hypothetical protein [Aeromonas sp. SrichE-2G]